MIKNFIRFIFIVSLTLLCSCQSNPTFDTFTTLLPWTKQYSQVQPGYEYILVSANGHQAVMALGSRESLPDNVARLRTHEYWYTGTGEMIHLVNGRVNKALGFTHEIRSQTQSYPSWEDLLDSKNPVTWFRKLDLMPGYRYNLLNNVSTYKISFPSDSPDYLPSRTQWIADSVESKSLDGRAWRYLQRFAIVDGVVFYSEQCIDKDLCLTIRKLGVVVPSK